MRHLKTWLLSLLGFSAIILLRNCGGAAVTYPDRPLKEKILYADPDHAGVLTHKRMGSNGKDFLIEEYNLANPLWRAALYGLHFVCNVNGELFFVAKDEDALIRIHFPFENEVLRMKQDFDFLVQSKTVCHSLLEYPLDEKW